MKKMTDKAAVEFLVSGSIVLIILCMTMKIAMQKYLNMVNAVFVSLVPVLSCVQVSWTQGIAEWRSCSCSPVDLLIGN